MLETAQHLLFLKYQKASTGNTIHTPTHGACLKRTDGFFKKLNLINFVIKTKQSLQSMSNKNNLHSHNAGEKTIMEQYKNIQLISKY